MASFSFIFGIFNQMIQYFQQINVKNVHLPSGVGIRTQDLLIMSLFPRVVKQIKQRCTVTLWVVLSLQLCFFLKRAHPGLFLLIFVLFTFQFKWQIFYLNFINWKKHRWGAWDSNPGRQDGSCRWIHLAMAAPLQLCFFLLSTMPVRILPSLCIAKRCITLPFTISNICPQS